MERLTPPPAGHVTPFLPLVRCVEWTFEIHPRRPIPVSYCSARLLARERNRSPARGRSPTRARLLPRERNQSHAHSRSPTRVRFLAHLIRLLPVASARPWTVSQLPSLFPFFCQDLRRIALLHNSGPPRRPPRSQAPPPVVQPDLLPTATPLTEPR